MLIYTSLYAPNFPIRKRMFRRKRNPNKPRFKPNGLGRDEKWGPFIVLRTSRELKRERKGYIHWDGSDCLGEALKS